MKKIILDFLCRRVRLFGESYSLGGMILVWSGLLLFLFLCGLMESL